MQVFHFSLKLGCIYLKVIQALFCMFLLVKEKIKLALTF